MTIAGRRFAEKKERKNDIARTARDPDRNKKKHGQRRDRGPCKTVPHRHQHMKDRGPGAEQDMNGMRKLGERGAMRKQDPQERERIDEPPLFDKADVGMRVRKPEETFPQVRDERIAHRPDPDRAQIADRKQGPEAAGASRRTTVEMEHGARNEGTKKNMCRMEEIKKAEGELFGQTGEQDQENNARERTEGRKRRVGAQLLEDGLEHPASDYAESVFTGKRPRPIPDASLSPIRPCASGPE